MKKEYFIGAVVGAVVVLVGVAIGYFLLKNPAGSAVSDKSKELSQNTTAPITPVNENQNKDVKIFKGSEFEFQYPSILIQAGQGNTVSLTHSVTYKHEDICDMRDGAQLLDKITDFDVTLTLLKKNLNETLRANIPENMIEDYFQGNAIRVSPGFIDEYKVGNVKGYKITEGAEGCGVYKYYLPLKSNVTLYVTRDFVPEFNPINTEYQKYLKVPGVIPPEQEESVFQSILASFKVK